MESISRFVFNFMIFFLEIEEEEQKNNKSI